MYAPPPPDPTPVARLTARQVEVLRQSCLGKTGTEIGEALFITDQTVKNHMTAAYDTLGIRAGSPGRLACYLMGLADATTVLPQAPGERPDDV
ncbi:helix-turn-helix transcriptional regulator [Nocardioides sp.]|uniref:helix-turn-helix domain-containing protein n=1 Tax=Nocardioides sp. TaxID=35761 RepID=UPI002CDBCD9A|nr:helix-turn-helix transcriptional regulator [Nocardioides sp.]HXH79502.1 helix-turn-helix transcriptional regulator [Nocardioides sp.]